MGRLRDLKIAEMRKRLRNVPVRWIGNALLLGGLALIGAASLGGRLVSTEPAPVVPSPSSTRVAATASTTSTTDQAAGLPETTPAPQATTERMAPPTRLQIPALNLDAPVVELPIQDKTWDMSSLSDEIAHLGGTANPGEKSNMVLAGHVTLRTGAGPFLHLERLKPGDTAIVYAGEEAYTYRVVRKKYVAPDDVSVTYPSSGPILTLITCTRWDAQNHTYTERVAVIARLAEEEIPDWTRSRVSPED
jgi:LPXTG-site transpeptidase (sortase) family protein